MKGMQNLILGLLFVFMTISATAQKADSEIRQTKQPKVFLIGEQPQVFEDLSISYDKLLLDVCDDDMNKAYGKWVDMLQEMEKHATDINFDIKGVKLWLKVFWEKDGTIAHIGYHLKPDSKNVKTKYLSAFLKSFSQNYKTRCEAEVRFSQYSSASFPTMY